MEIYLVGGAIRDTRLGLPVKERDWVVVGATPQDMLDLGYQPVGKDFPVFLHPQSKEEYALARTERKTGHGYTGFETCADPGITLEQDLLRRDLTINAMAETPEGELVDPYKGMDDLNNGVLRHVSPAFSEDPVRVLRTARFAARFEPQGFHVAHDTNALMRRMVQNGEVSHLVAERVWAELVKALDTEKPARLNWYPQVPRKTTTDKPILRCRYWNRPLPSVPGPRSASLRWPVIWIRCTPAVWTSMHWPHFVTVTGYPMPAGNWRDWRCSNVSNYKQRPPCRPRHCWEY